MRGAGFHVVQAMPSRCVRGRGADAVIDDPQDDVIGHHHLDLHERRPGVTGDVAECFAQRGEELGGDIVTHAAVDRTVEEAPGFEPRRPDGLATESQHPVSQIALADAQVVAVQAVGLRECGTTRVGHPPTLCCVMPTQSL